MSYELQPFTNCPECGGTEFIEGPHGGDAVNFCCAKCFARFNDLTPFPIERHGFVGEADRVFFRGKYTPVAWSEKSAAKVIEINPELERRVALRRRIDMSDREMAKRFRQAVADAQFQYSHWAKLAGAAGHTGYQEGRAHAYAAFLSFYAEMKVLCPCTSCTEVRMKAKEEIAAGLSEAQKCEQIAKEQS